MRTQEVPLPQAPRTMSFGSRTVLEQVTFALHIKSKQSAEARTGVHHSTRNDNDIRPHDTPHCFNDLNLQADDTTGVVDLDPSLAGLHTYLGGKECNVHLTSNERFTILRTNL